MSRRKTYQRIARWYDLLDAPFERKRYQSLRPLLFEGLKGGIPDAGVGTGPNSRFYPEGSETVPNTHLRPHRTKANPDGRLRLEKKKKTT